MRYQDKLIEPSWVVELGKCYHISETRKKGKAKQGADLYIDTVNDSIEFFKPGTKGRKYMEKLRAEAISYGEGKTSRMQEYVDIRGEIKEEMEKKKKRIGRGFWSYTFRLLQDAGSGYAAYLLTPPLMNLFKIDADPETQGSVSTAVGIFTGIGVDFLGRWYTDRRKDKIERKYKDDLLGVGDDYRKKMRTECEVVLERIKTAWEESFGELPKETMDIKALIDSM